MADQGAQQGVLGSPLPTFGSSLSIFSSPPVASPAASPAKVKHEDAVTPLSGEFPTYSAGAQKASRLKMTELVNYRTEVSYYLGHQIAVSAEFLCYCVKGGMIRVISFTKQNAKTLLRGHTSLVHDMDILERAGHDEQLLVSCAKDGNCFVWKLQSEAAADASDIASSSVVQLMREKPGDYVARVMWHPRDQDCFVTVGQEPRVLIWSLSKLQEIVARSSQMVTLDHAEVQSQAALFNATLLTPVTQLGFSIDGTQLALGQADGTVTVFSSAVRESSAGTILRQFEPHTSAVSALLYGAPTDAAPFLITAAKHSTEFRLWDVATWTCVHSFALQYGPETVSARSLLWGHGRAYGLWLWSVVCGRAISH